jgi:hypothetical protein
LSASSAQAKSDTTDELKVQDIVYEVKSDSIFAKRANLPGLYSTQSNEAQESQVVAFLIDTAHKIGKIEDLGYIHYDTGLKQVN